MRHLVRKLDRVQFFAALDIPCPVGHGPDRSSCWIVGKPPRLALCAARVHAVAHTTIPEEKS